MSVETPVMETKERILNTAISLFAEKGFKGTSIRDIADKAHINTYMISYYFHGKKGILKEILEKLVQGFNRILANDNISLDSDTVILNKLEEILVFFAKHSKEISILLNEVRLNYEGLESIQIIFKEKLKEVTAYISKVTGVAQEESLTDVILLAEMWLGMIFSDHLLDARKFLNYEDHVSTEIANQKRMRLILRLSRLLLDNKDILVS